MGLIKSQTDLRSIKEAGRITESVLSALGDMLKPGLSTVALETEANRLLAQSRSSAPFRSYEGFSHAICVSFNEEIVNGLPSRERFIKEGDLVSIATAAEHRGMHGKSARTWYIGQEPADDVRRLLQGTQEAITAVIAASKQSKKLNELLQVIPQTAAKYRLTIFETLGGAGIGKKMHEHPYVPNDPEAMDEIVPLQPGLAFTLMPMFSLGGNPEFDTHADGWTYLARDGALCAHFADSLLMTDDGLLNLTAGPRG